jgi:hypothetical protein
MSVLTNLLSFSVARGLAALLAVVLSAVGGGRLAIDRLTPERADDKRSSVVCPLVAAQACGQARSQTGHGRSFAIGRWAAVAVVALSVTAADHLSAPSLLIGSAGGPRAP